MSAWRDDIWPLHGSCEPRPVNERRQSLINEIADALHRNTCCVVHEQFGEWDVECATHLVRRFEELMAYFDNPAGLSDEEKLDWTGVIDEDPDLAPSGSPQEGPQ